MGASKNLTEFLEVPNNNWETGNGHHYPLFAGTVFKSTFVSALWSYGFLPIV